MENISFEDFKKLDLRIGKIISSESVEGSEKLLKLEVDFGELGKRQILAGIAKHYNPDELIGKLCPFVFNLEPKEIMGVESQGMILVADSEGPVLISPDREVKSGSNIK